MDPPKNKEFDLNILKKRNIIGKGFRSAYKASFNSSVKRFHHGASLYRGGSIISIGWNVHSHSTWKEELSGNIQTRHAEMQCIHGMPKSELDNSILFIVRRKMNGELGISNPCKVCAQTLNLINFKMVYYSTDEGYACKKPGEF